MGLRVIDWVFAFITLSATFIGLCIFPANAFGGEAQLLRCWKSSDLKVKPREQFAKRSKAGSKLTFKDYTFRGLPEIQKLMRGSIRRVSLRDDQKLVAITFDLCEGPFEIAGYDGSVIDYLREKKVKATLFVGGKWLENHKERAAQLIADPLFEIGSHGWSHRNLRGMTGVRLWAEIERVQFAYERAYDNLLARQCMKSTGLGLFKTNFGKPRKLSLFRFPFGTCSKEALTSVNKRGMLAVQWDVVTGDPAFGQSAKRIASVVLARTKPGSIIIAHANGRGRNTAKALPLFIPKLRSKGYKFVTVSELLKSGTPQIAKTCYENRPGDNSHYK